MKKVLVKEPVPYFLSANRSEENAQHILDEVLAVAAHARATGDIDVGALRSAVRKAEDAVRHAQSRGASDTELERLGQALEEAQRTLRLADPRPAERLRERGVTTNANPQRARSAALAVNAETVRSIKQLCTSASGSMSLTREQAATLRRAGWTFYPARY